MLGFFGLFYYFYSKKKNKLMNVFKKMLPVEQSLRLLVKKKHFAK